MFKRNLLSVALAAVLTAGSLYAQATEVNNSTVRAFGASSTTTDQLYSSVDIRTNKTLLASASNSLIFLTDNVGSVLDQVWQDNTTGKLSFLTRIVMTQAGYEVNDIVRSGFTGFTTDIQWFRETGSNLATQGFRLKSAGRTSSIGTTADVYDANHVNLRSDISVEEGKPTSGWYVINTDATSFTTLTGTTASNYGMFLRSTGEDVGAPASLYISAFAPTTVVAVPESDTYAMLLAGLGIVGFVARRRSI
jgi:hypothetical protein